MTPRLLQGNVSNFVGLGAAFLLTGCAASSPPGAEKPIVATRLQLGMAYLARGDLDAARRNLESALAAAPRDYRTQLGMALYEQRIGEYQAAERRYQHARQYAPENGSVMNNYGAFLCSLGQYVAAQQQFSAAAQLPDYRQVALALENAGYCYFTAGQHDMARVFLDRALQHDPAKGTRLLSEVALRLDAQKYHEARQLLDVYQHSVQQHGLTVSAESLWLEIRFAALAGHEKALQAYGDKLARSFPQSKQYQQFLANEY